MRNQTLLVLLLTAVFPSNGFAEIYDLGGMYTYHYSDGRYRRQRSFLTSCVWSRHASSMKAI